MFKIKQFKWALALLAIFGLVVMDSCSNEGPAGVDGVDANASCTECHSADPIIVAKILQWEKSGHGMGEAAESRAWSGSCSRCHTEQGFQDYIATGSSSAENEPVPIGCRACHDIHSTYTYNDFGLRTSTSPSFPSDSMKTFDGGKGNLCATCHVPRSEVENGDFAAAFTAGTSKYYTNASGVYMYSNTSTHYGPHHGPQGAILSGQGGYSNDGQTLTSTTAHYSGNPNMTDTCVQCHMGDLNVSTGNHTFKLTYTDENLEIMTNLDNCNTSLCHAGGITTLDRDGKQTALSNGMVGFTTGLLTDGFLAIDADGIHPVATNLTEAQAGAIYNFFLVYEDGSAGIHNFKYASNLIQGSADALGYTLTW
jgi:hypothetical protein